MDIWECIQTENQRKIEVIAPGSCRIRFTPVDVLGLHRHWPWTEREAAIRTAKSQPDGAQLTANLKSTCLTLSTLKSYMFCPSHMCPRIVLLLKRNPLESPSFPHILNTHKSLHFPFHFCKKSFLICSNIAGFLILHCLLNIGHFLKAQHLKYQV